MIADHLRLVVVSGETDPPPPSALDRARRERDLWRARHAVAAAQACREARWRWRLSRFLGRRLARFALGIVVGFALGWARWGGP